MSERPDRDIDIVKGYINRLETQEAQLKIATLALEKISKITIEVSFYKEPTYEAQIAKEALEQIKKGES